MQLFFFFFIFVAQNLGSMMTSNSSDVRLMLTVKELRDCWICHETHWSKHIIQKSASALKFCISPRLLGIKMLHNISTLWRLVSVKRRAVVQVGKKRKKNCLYAKTSFQIRHQSSLRCKNWDISEGDLHLLLHIMLPFDKSWLSVTWNERRILTVCMG